MQREPAYFGTSLIDETKRNYFSLFPAELMASVLDSFIINRPMSGKVGGDGFWVHQDQEHLYIAVFDCMGHGHLASMMTRKYTQSFQKILEEGRYKDPGAILEQLHLEIEKKFGKKENLLVGTGADVGLLKIRLSAREMEFAGSRIDLLYFRKGGLEVIKADRIQIGELFDYEHKYHTKAIRLEEGVPSNFYLSTDGLKDLIGSSEGKKLGRKGMINLLKENVGKPLPTQKRNIGEFIEDWSGSQMQLDDILLIGFAL